MRRSICYCDPNYAIAGETRTWRFVHTTPMDLPKGTTIKFDLNSEGRPFDWQLPTVNSTKANTIWAELPNNKTIKPKVKESVIPQFEFTLPCDIKVGENFIIAIGTTLQDQDKKGNTCQTFVERKKLFYLYIDPKGKGDYKEAEQFHIDIRGNELKNLKIITPSFVTRNKRFDVIVRFEDEFGNLTNNAPTDTLIDLSYEHLRENLSWKLFVPETGFITLPNLYFNEPGIYKIQLRNLKTNSNFLSPPIKCFADSEMNLFWGVLHGESNRVDSSDNIENFLRFSRDETSYQFISTSTFDCEKETPNDLWKSINQKISDFNEEDRFVSFLGFQWIGTPGEEGARQFIYLKDNKPILRKKDLKSNSLKKIYKTHNPKDLLSIPVFTMGKNSEYNFADYNPEFERVIEIYNAWGSSECLEKDGNIYPIKGEAISSKEGSIREALNNNCRFGFIAGGYDDRGIYSTFYDSNQEQYTPGLTAIIAKNHSRESLFNALYNRKCYATTGEKMIIGFYIADEFMGSELNTYKKPGLQYNRYISGFAIGTKKIKTVEIIRNSKVITSFQPHENSFDFQFDDTEPLDEIAFEAKGEKPAFVYYYLRVTQEDGNTAWASPIWIDIITEEIAIKNNKKPKKTKSSK